MSENINVTLPDNIAKYLHKKSKVEYLPISAVARQYIAKSVTEELVFDYHQKCYSLTKIAELVDIPKYKVMEILRKLNEELDDLSEELDEL
jgi:predicted HTH domain antitoxin